MAPARLRPGRAAGALLAVLLLEEVTLLLGEEPLFDTAAALHSLDGDSEQSYDDHDLPDPGVNETNDGGSKAALCAKFDKYYKRKFPDSTESPCDTLYDYPKFTEGFKEYMGKYKPLAYNSSRERKLRFANFAANMVFMLQSGKKPAAFTMAVNEYADMSPDEFRQTRLGLNETRPTLGSEPPTGQSVPASLDWVALGGVTTPVNQGQCNSCWTFATSGALEGAWFAQTGSLVSLSEQQFLDCTGGGLGCTAGGNLEAPYDKVAERHAVCTGDSYPYTGQDGTCHQSSCITAIPHGAIQAYKAVQPDNEQALKEALVNVGPVAVGIDAGGDEVRFYKSGVLTAPCSDQLNHAVLVVGYGFEDPNPYWKIKNSWGTNWGEGGFFRLVRGLSGSGECGVKSIPTVPVITTDNVQIPTDVVTAAPAVLNASNGGGLLSNTYLVLALVALAGILIGGCAYLMCCGAGGRKTRGAEIDPLYSPVGDTSSGEESDESPRHRYSH